MLTMTATLGAAHTVVVVLTGEENAVQVAVVPTQVEESADLGTKVPKAGHKKRRYRVATTYYPCCLPALGEFVRS